MWKKIGSLFSLILFMLACSKQPTNIHAPYFEVKGLDGKIHTLNDYKGKPLLLIFWATWCPTCKKELKKIADNYQRLKEAGIEILLISMDKSEDSVKRVAQEHGFANLPIAIISDQMVMDYQNVRFLPTGLLIDPQGFIRKRFVGELPPEEIIRSIKQLKSKAK
ncbi:thiol-disulfide oxidoreductase [Thermosulfidibacter takaii ABI70S6]|uniref:Thiol-disulfide oxidoreductase n=1 Tax=Thermosulfidibacter takaii (strain DSM 17441 / JCM 13301 / NBRC 103674 / ABI70S6) TaxID=1298851 RepID=A0A0S3QS54_THET7|nr:redoxin domain-containing protein [Thermosulfidibacter takaii]BAT71168.1 thiol-disulfide oxidoreductase [Thermosulfidibacter takaii ABI70S6]